uniref:G-protein coupled receptors family 1 profile domain-containing protein n=1 Tax=Oreochromis aureus TaxID=47969 RepID=A0A668VTH0_OREAU
RCMGGCARSDRKFLSLDAKCYHFSVKQIYLQSFNIMSIAVFSLVSVLGVLGNGVVIWVTGCKMKKTVNTVWYLHLAVADFIFATFLPLTTSLALQFHWPFGNFMCKLCGTLIFLNLFPVSTFWCLCVWVVALILSAPYFIFRDVGPSYHNKDIINCFNNFALSDDEDTYDPTELFRHQAMIFTRFLLGFVVPFTVIVSCYAVIIHSLRRNRTLANQSSRPFKIITAIIITFFLCWSPFHIMGLIEMANSMPEYSSEILDDIIIIGSPIATSLAFLNSCLNPLLYVFMGQDFKDKVRKSILNVLESAFQEEISRSYTYTNSMITTRSKEKSFSDAEL